MIDFVFRNQTTDKKYNSNFFEKILIAGVKELKLNNRNIEVSISLVEEGRIKKLNKKYRGKNRVTDVLSFPMNERTDLGDIFICLPFAKKQAKSENVSIDGKLAQLTVHGFLHLVGYDHEKSKNESDKMIDLEKRILRKL